VSEIVVYGITVLTCTEEIDDGIGSLLADLPGLSVSW